MKKITMILLVCAMVLSAFSGCGAENTVTDRNDSMVSDGTVDNNGAEDGVIDSSSGGGSGVVGDINSGLDDLEDDIEDAGRGVKNDLEDAGRGVKNDLEDAGRAITDGKDDNDCNIGNDMLDDANNSSRRTADNAR